ncbi:MAG: FAD-dependent oxidoreductase [Kiritimatiellia bacterium]|nr:FAD-dependent oxidoreductase [Kiritimatiellia bacterium]
MKESGLSMDPPGWLDESARKTPIADDVDVCVIGGSCTGVFAAVRAARLGARVAIVENNGFFGGVATAGLVSIWHSAFDWEGRRQIVGGLSLEVIERLKKRDAVQITHPPTPHRAYVFNPEEMKIELDALVLDQGIRPFFHARFVEALRAESGMAAAVIEDKSGRRAITARVFIDATGDGDVLARLGLPYTMNENPQPPTVNALFDFLGGIYEKNKDFDLSAEVHDARHPQALRQGYLWGSSVVGRPHTTMVAGTRSLRARCADADDLTRAELECRRQVRAIRDILHDRVPGGERVVLSGLSAHIGVRESRHAQCLHTLTREDVLEGRAFDDAIGFGTYGADVHHGDRAGITMQYLDGTQKTIVPGEPTQHGRWRPESEGITPFYQIPYRSLVPVGSRNLLVAGRLIGADRSAYGAIRVMMNCNQTGEAAGVAAVLSLDRAGRVADVPAELLRRTLQAGGSLFPDQP